jgi:hypothetical protein
MEGQNSVSYQNKLKRLSRQMAQSEQLLQHHPLVKGKWAILQTLLNRFNWQMQWSMAGPSARLLMTFQTALYAQGTEQSQTGFMGPAILQIQQLMGRLIQASLKPSERDLAPLLVTVTQLIAMGAIFIATQLVENWKSLFPQDEDPIAAEKAGWLLREMGLNFLLGSKAAESAFCSVGKGMGLKEESKKKITDIGMCYLLTSLFLLHEDDSSQEESFLDTVKHFLEPTLHSIEQALQEAEKERIIEKEQAFLALNQIQMIRQALNKGNREELKQALSTSFDMLGMSIQEVKRDIGRISAFCAQINRNFKNIFDRTPMTATTIQAA